MSTTTPIHSKPYLLMNREEQALDTESLRLKFARAIACFILLGEKRGKPDTTFRVKGIKVPAWYLGWTSNSEHDGGAGWRIYVDSLGNLYKGPLRRPIVKFTRGQMLYAIKTIEQKLGKRRTKELNR